MIDFANLTLTGLVAFGVVNVITMFKPNIDSRLKFGISFLIALGVTFIPVEIGNILFKNVKLALEAALSASAIYKVAAKVGGSV